MFFFVTLLAIFFSVEGSYFAEVKLNHMHLNESKLEHRARSYLEILIVEN